MKKFISSIRNKKLKGNVSLLVIFILLASSVISLLSINQIQRLLTYWNTTFNYFRAFYLAKAWTELGLSEVYYREAWFQQNIGSWNIIVTENLVWEAYSGFNPYFTMNITWDFKLLTNDIRYTNDHDCTGSNKITLGTWEWIMLSLFNDKTSWIKNILTGTNEHNIKGLDDDFIKNIDITKKEGPMGFNFTFWLFNYDSDWNMENIVVEKWTDLNSFLKKNIESVTWNRRYLTIKNPWTWNEVVSFCIHNKNGKLVPYSDSLITVRGNYGNMEVWLQSVVKKEVPFWAMDVLWWE